jgi:hypothetical protein
MTNLIGAAALTDEELARLELGPRQLEQIKKQRELAAQAAAIEMPKVNYTIDLGTGRSRKNHQPAVGPRPQLKVKQKREYRRLLAEPGQLCTYGCGRNASFLSLRSKNPMCTDKAISCPRFYSHYREQTNINRRRKSKEGV